MRDLHLRYSEAEMGDAFREVLTAKSGLPGIGRLWKVFEELQCQRGRPDFVALAKCEQRRLRGSGEGLSLAESTVMAILKKHAARTTGFIAARTGLTDRTIQRALDQLIREKYVEEVLEGRFVLGVNQEIVDVETWAFELKLDNPSRAVFQAKQYRAFANRVLIVVPPRQVDLYSRFEESMRKWGLGLASFDPLLSKFEMKRPPRSQVPASRQHHLYAVFQLLRESSKR